MASDLQIVVYDSFAAIESQWRQFEQTATNYAFQSFDWLNHWYQTTGNPAKLQLCLCLILSGNDQVVMLLPLGLEKRNGLRCLTWLGGQVADYHAPLLTGADDKQFSKADFFQLWHMLCLQLPAFDAIYFEKMPVTINEQINPFTYLPCITNASSAHYTDLGKNYEAFLKSRLSNNALKAARRNQRRIEEQGQLEFVIATEPKQIQRLLTSVMQQKTRSYEEMGVADLFSELGIAEFFKHISANRLVHLSALLLNGQPLACHWGLVYKNRFYYLYPSYDRNDLIKYSPGTVLLFRLFEWCIENQLTTFDFTIGDEPYKDKWCNNELAIVDFYQAKTLLGHLLVMPVLLIKHLKRTIKQSALLWQTAQTTRSWLAKLKQSAH